MSTKKQINPVFALKCIKEFLPLGEYQSLRSNLSSTCEEHKFFEDKVCEMYFRIQEMPKSYDQKDKCDDAVAHLHYFYNGCNWYIIEKDVDTDGEGQIQAFGLADLGYGSELGYISIKELTECGVQLDLHFTPKTVKEIQEKHPRM